MKKRESISHIMTKNVATVQNNASLRDVAKLIKEHSINHLPVLHGDKVVGIVSSSDLNRLTLGKLFDHQEGYDEAVFEMFTLNQLMTHDPLTVTTSDTVKDAAEIFAKASFHALLVVEDDKLVGIVTTKDVIQYFLDQL